MLLTMQAAAPDICWVMQVSLLDLPRDILHKIFTIICTSVPDARAFKGSTKSMREVADDTWPRWMRICRQQLRELAGFDSVLLSILLFMYIDVLQTTVGEAVKALAELHSTFSVMVGKVIASTFMVLHITLLLTTKFLRVGALVLARPALAYFLTHRKMVMNPDSDPREVKMMLYGIQVDGLGEVDVRLTVDTQAPYAFHPVTISFCVQSHEAAQKVQALLLLMGEAANSCPQVPDYTRDAFSAWQRKFKEREQKANVEVRLEGVQNWITVPPALSETPMSNPTAWQVVANVFQNLEVHPETGPGYIRQATLAVPTVFGTLRVLCVQSTKKEMVST